MATNFTHFLGWDFVLVVFSSVVHPTQTQNVFQFLSKNFTNEKNGQKKVRVWRRISWWTWALTFFKFWLKCFGSERPVSSWSDFDVARPNPKVQDFRPFLDESTPELHVIILFMCSRIIHQVSLHRGDHFWMNFSKPRCGHQNASWTLSVKRNFWNKKSSELEVHNNPSNKWDLISYILT